MQNTTPHDYYTKQLTGPENKFSEYNSNPNVDIKMMDDSHNVPNNSNSAFGMKERPMPMNDFSSPPAYEGVLYKKSPNIFHGWQKRWGKLHDSYFWYYEDDNKKKPNGCLDFRHVHVRIEASLNKPEFKLHIEGNSKVFELKCETNQQKELWVKHIHMHTEAAISKKKESNSRYF